MIKEIKLLFLGIAVPVTDGSGIDEQKSMPEMGFLQLQREPSCQEGSLRHRNGDISRQTGELGAQCHS